MRCSFGSVSSFVLLVAGLVSLGLAMPAFAQADAPGQERDRTTELLERAEASYHKALEVADRRILAGFDSASRRAADRGDLDQLDTLKAEREQYEAQGEMPKSRSMRREVESYTSAVKRATDSLVRAYERAVREYTREQRIDEAKAVRSKLGLLQAKQTLDVKSFNGHWYVLISKQVSWQEAELACEKMGGHLVTISSAQENDFVRRLIPPKRRGDQGAWIGATDAQQEQQWRWSNGEPWGGYSNWADYAAKANKQHNHGAISLQGGWVDLPERSGWVRFYICEWSPAEAQDPDQDKP